MMKANHVFIVGIKGTAMSHIAVFLKTLGMTVTGADVSEEFITDKTLSEHHIDWQVGFSGLLPEETDLVIYSAAHGGRANPFVSQALEMNVPVISQPQALDEIMKHYSHKIAVAGCHGKTTTSSLLAFALLRLGQQPGYLIGVPSFGTYPGSSVGKKPFFVIEADEYGVNPPLDKTPKLLFLHPNEVICTNIDFDHPDVYVNLEETKETFMTFFKGKKLYLCVDDPVIRSTLPHIDKDSVTTFGWSSDADICISQYVVENGKSKFNISNRGHDIGTFFISLFGKKNISNVAGVVAILLHHGFKPGAIREAIVDFKGPKRRFEHLATSGGVDLFDDYGHHPAEIVATLKAARDRFPGRRILVVFQPHTYSRTKALLSEFAHALEIADNAFVLPIFASARERKEDFAVTSEDIASRGTKRGLIRAFETKNELLKTMAHILHTGDVVILMGAGDVYMLQNDIIKYMKGALSPA